MNAALNRMTNDFAKWRVWASDLRDKHLPGTPIHCDAGLLCRIMDVHDEFIHAGCAPMGLQETIDMLVGRLVRKGIPLPR